MISLTTNLRDLSDKLWKKIKQDNPDRKVSQAIMDVMIHISKIAELNPEPDWLKEPRETSEKDRVDSIRQHIAKAIILLLIISKDLEVDVWEALNEEIL